MAEIPTPKRGRRGDPQGRRQAILDAALATFLAEGFDAAKLEAIARRAGVAKGTIYLYFADKEALFRALVEETIGPLLQGGEALVGSFEGSTAELLRILVETLVREVLETQRRELLRLVFTEAPRFPWLAEFYYQTVVRRGLLLIRAIARRGQQRGDLGSDALERFPQLLPVPLLFGVIWSTLFQRLEPLDLAGFARTYVELLIAGLEKPGLEGKTP